MWQEKLPSLPTKIMYVGQEWQMDVSIYIGGLVCECMCVCVMGGGGGGGGILHMKCQ